MFTRVKTTKEINNMRISGLILAQILEEIRIKAQPGVTGKEIDDFALKQVTIAGAKCAFKGYNGFPGHICISKNDEIVHGIPNIKPLKKGDVVSFDFGITYRGMITDAAFTMVIGEKPSGDKKRLIETTENSLYVGLEEVGANDHTGDISAAIEVVLKEAKLGIIRELVGHGIGHQVHERPDIPNYGRIGTGTLLKRNMTVAIEPMATLGSSEIKTDDDKWTIRTRDGSIAAHFEHTVLVTGDGCEILTKL